MRGNASWHSPSLFWIGDWIVKMFDVKRYYLKYSTPDSKMSWSVLP